MNRNQALIHSLNKHISSNYCVPATVLDGRDITAYRLMGIDIKASTRWQQDPQFHPVVRTCMLIHGFVQNAVR